MSGGPRRRPRRSALLLAVVAALLATVGVHALDRTAHLGEAYAATRAAVDRAVGRAAGATAEPVTSAPPSGASDPVGPVQAATPTVSPTVTPAAAPPLPACRPRVAPVDPDADPAARCLAETLDRWAADGTMAVGQQVNISSDTWDRPLRALRPHRARVVGFDLDELLAAHRRGTDWTADLAALAADGVVLTASWHAANPWTGGPAFDTGGGRLEELLDDDSPAAQRFRAEWADALALLARLQEQGAAVLVRPLHEAGGDWFWWGRPDPATYRALFADLQEQAADAGVHNLLWAYGAAVRTWEGVDEPTSLLPGRIDLAGLDTYDCETPHPDCGGLAADELAQDRVDLTGYAALAAAAPRVALTEVGPHHSPDGAWDPVVVPRTLAEQGLRAAYAMFWFDDDGGRKQLSSLRGGREWLASCPEGLCKVG